MRSQWVQIQGAFDVVCHNLSRLEISHGRVGSCIKLTQNQVICIIAVVLTWDWKQISPEYKILHGNEHLLHNLKQAGFGPSPQFLLPYTSLQASKRIIANWTAMLQQPTVRARMTYMSANKRKPEHVRTEKIGLLASYEWIQLPLLMPNWHIVEVTLCCRDLQQKPWTTPERIG